MKGLNRHRNPPVSL